MIRAQIARVEAELKNDILPFWLQYARDREHGGFWGQINNDLTVRKRAPRGALLTSRILWTFSAAYRRYRDPAYLEMARWAYDDLLARFWDNDQGGLYWSVSADGHPLETRKVIYGQAFGIYALAEYHRATGDRAPLDRAIALYRAVEAHAHDRTNRGYFEEFSREWKRLPNSRRSFVSPAPKSQNTLLHVMEAYANLLRVWPDPELRGNLRDLVDVMLTRVLDPANHHLRLFLDEDWTPRSDGISYGHDIEFSWLLPETAEVLGNPDLLAQTKALAVDIARATLAEGVDTDGGVFGLAGPKGLIDGSKEWWPQAEATVGFLNAYQQSGDGRFLKASLHSWSFIATHLIDREHGEWFQMVNRDGTLRAWMPKVSLWKCPYHDGRACMQLIDRLKEVLTAAAPPGASETSKPGP
ncbi:MAG TPA: AGE family epimerase/isomerase [Opitutaceae bacterium]|nr:AGE family epimerase/isomerase [Opitutaceae bacterium]